MTYFFLAWLYGWILFGTAFCLFGFKGNIDRTTVFFLFAAWPLWLTLAFTLYFSKRLWRTQK